MENLYLLLQVNENASMPEIEKAYKKLVKKYHPDIAKDKAKAEEIMKKINNAYDILGDKDKKKEYDNQLFAIREKLKQKEARSSGVSYSNPNKYREDIKQKYKEYYEDINNNNNYAGYNKYQQYNRSANNIYQQNNEEYDRYVNHLGFFGKICNLSSTSKRILIMFVLIIMLCLYKVTISLKKKLEPINSNSSSEVDVSNESSSKKANNNDDKAIEYISDETPKYEYLQFIDKLKTNQIYIINNYLSSSYKLSEQQIKNMNNNSGLISKIAKELTVSVRNCDVTNKGVARLSVEINRVNMNNIILDISYNNIYKYSSFDVKNLKQEIIDRIDDGGYSKLVQSDVVWLVKEDGKWKVQFTVNNLYNLFGIDVSQEIG